VTGPADGALRLLRRLRRLLRQRALDREMDEEVREHLRQETAERVARGMAPAEARRTALRDFGPADRFREEARAARGWRPFDEVRQDLRFGLRGLARAPGFTVLALATLALGIGANTAVFSLVRGVLLRDLPFPAAERLVRLHEYDRSGQGRGTISHANMVDWRERATTLDGVAAYDEWRVSLEADDGASVMDGAAVSAAFFDVLGVRPLHGRFFLPEEDAGTSRVVVLSHALWLSRYGAESGVVGRSLRINGYAYEVVGIAPPGLEDPALSGPSFEPPVMWRPSLPHFASNSRGARSFTAIARLAEGTSLETARAELSTIHAALALEYPAENAGHVVRAVPLMDSIVAPARRLLVLLMGAVGLVLLVACANVANLQLSRAAGRRRELAVRTALGASRGRVARQLLVESTLLGILGGAAGVALGAIGTRMLVLIGAGQLPRLEQVRMDGAVLAYVAAAALLTGLLFGLLPALGTRSDTASTMREAGGRATPGRARNRARAMLVTVEVAMAVVLLAGAALLGRSLLNLHGIEPGFRAAGVLTFRLSPPAEYDAARLDILHEQLRAELGALPAVSATGSVDILPLSGSFNGMGLRVEGRPEVPGQLPSAETRAATPGFFEVMGIPVLQGRGITHSDRAGAPPVMVVSRALADDLWPGGNALGSRVDLGDGVHRQVVGIVGDVSQFSLEEGPSPTAYLPDPQAMEWMRFTPTVVLRTAIDPLEVADAARAAVHAIDPRLAIFRMRSMEQVVGATLGAPRFRTFLLALFAGLAYVLGAVGVYGVVTQGVAERRGELGVRMALGARRAQVVGLVMRQGLRPVLLGLMLGLVGALLAGRLLAAFLFQVAPLDPLTFLVVPLALLSVACMAAAVPALRAARTHPASVLRAE